MTLKTELPHRDPGLDGLRGIAALSVALGHCWLEPTGLGLWSTSLRDFPHMPMTDITARIVSALLPSDAAVTVFFVLSGHVLWQSFGRRHLRFWRDLPDYVAARSYRLLPLTIVTTIPISFVANATARAAVANMFLFSHSLNGVLWSLQVEIAASFLLFALWGATKGIGWKMGVGLLCAGSLLPRWHAEPLVMFFPAFILGAWIGTTPACLWRSGLLLTGAVLVLLFANLIFGHGGPDRCAEMVAATVLVGAVAHGRFRWLRRRPVVFLGTISYPFYLTHSLGLALAHPVVLALKPDVAWQVFLTLAVVSIPAALLLAWVLHRLVELPAQVARPRLHWPFQGSGQLKFSQR